MNEKYEVVPISEVPEPPPARNGRRALIYAQVKALGTDGRQALRIPVKNGNDLANTRAQLGQMARRDGRMLCTSRSKDSTVLWAWTVRRESKG